MVSRLRKEKVLLGALLLAATVVLTGSCGPSTPPALAQVEAVFDVPREYRVLSSLPCAKGAGLVYVVSSEGDLHSFQPDVLQFRRIGQLSCLADSHSRPNSMAVDRSGTAWLSFHDGSLYRASIRDASCSRTSYEPSQHGFTRFGMAFASSGPALSEETLFVWGGLRSLHGYQRRPERQGIGLARIDTKALRLTPIGADGSRLSAQRAELTGTADGKLFGFFATHPATLAQIDPNSGATSMPRRLRSIRTGRAWAFSFWGGDFWFYWAPWGHTSHVSRLSEADGSVQRMMEDVGFLIVGAGVSTCAPTGRP